VQASPKSPVYWVQHLFRDSSTPTEVVAAQLVRKGILEVAEDRFLWIFPRPVFPSADDAPEHQVRDEIRQTAMGQKRFAASVAALVAVLQGCGALSLVLSEREQDEHGERIERLVESAPHAESVRNAVRRAIAEDSAAATAATMTATSS
jgi:hypothetical protein